MKIYRAILIIVLFFVVMYAFKGYLNTMHFGIGNVFGLKSSSTILGTNISSSTDPSNDQNSVTSGNIASILLDKIKNIESNGGYSPNRDNLPPVIGKNDANTVNGKLTDDGVFFNTNIERVRQSLPELKRNSVLDRSAQNKLNDMFGNQYFEHVSPSGVSVSDVVGGVGYKFLVVGENLALGNFAGDTKVVAAWMASPGHRENILDKRYTEIGIAVGYGLYKGRMQWLAVQHFARPMSSCPSPNSSLKDKISNDKNDLIQREEDIASMKRLVDKTESSDSSFASTVSSYNALVNDYNNRLKNLKTEITNYNAQVVNFNSCLDAVTTSIQ